MTACCARRRNETEKPKRGGLFGMFGKKQPKQHAPAQQDLAGQPGYGTGQRNTGIGQPGYGTGQQDIGTGQPGYGTGQRDIGTGQPGYGTEQREYTSAQPAAGTGGGGAWAGSRLNEPGTKGANIAGRVSQHALYRQHRVRLTGASALHKCWWLFARFMTSAAALQIWEGNGVLAKLILDLQDAPTRDAAVQPSAPAMPPSSAAPQKKGGPLSFYH